MAKETSTELWIGSDTDYDFTIKNAAETLCIDITGWTLSWMVKRNKGDLDNQAILTKTTSSGIAISGSFNATPSVNTQKATVTVADTDTDALSPGMYYYELKRTTAGAEQPLAFGVLDLLQGVHRS